MWHHGCKGMIRKTIIVVLTLAALGTGVLWGASHVIVGEVFEQGGTRNTGISWGDTFPREGFFCGVTEGRFVILPTTRWDYERQEYTRGGFWDWATKQVVLDPRGGDSVRGVQMPMWFLFALFAGYPAIAFIRGPLRRWRRRQRGQCIECAYDLTGNESGTCSECGAAVDRA